MFFFNPATVYLTEYAEQVINTPNLVDVSISAKVKIFNENLWYIFVWPYNWTVVCLSGKIYVKNQSFVPNSVRCRQNASPWLRLNTTTGIYSWSCIADTASMMFDQCRNIRDVPIPLLQKPLRVSHVLNYLYENEVINLKFDMYYGFFVGKFEYSFGCCNGINYQWF